MSYPKDELDVEIGVETDVEIGVEIDVDMDVDIDVGAGEAVSFLRSRKESDHRHTQVSQVFDPRCFMCRAKRTVHYLYRTALTRSTRLTSRLGFLCTA